LPATIVDVLGLQNRSPFPGNSLARYWNGSTRSLGEPGAPPGALSEVVPLDPLNPDPAQLVAQPWPLAAFCDREWTYIRRDGDVREELFHVREDASEQINLAGDPAHRAKLEQMRRDLARQTGGTLTPKRFNR
jgi:hypothetical protein